MATDLQPAYAALEKAHAAGDSKSAQKLADYIRQQQAAGEVEAAKAGDSISTVPLHPVEMAGDALSSLNPSSWFQSKDPVEVSAEEALGKVGGGAAGGALAGAVLPGTLKAVGKVVPGIAGKASSALGEMLSRVPLKERVVRGAGGGAAMGAVDAVADATGAAPAVKLGAELLGGGLGESAASFLTKETGQLLRFVGNASYGNVAGASRALGGMLQPNRALNAATAAKLQKRLFGERTDGFIEGLIGTDNRIAAQEAMRKADPTLSGAGPRDPNAVRPPWQGEATGEMHPVSGGTDLAAAGAAGKPPGFGPQGAAGPGLGGPTIAAGGPAANPLAPVRPIAGSAGPEAAGGAAIPGMAAGKAGAKAKLTAAQAEQAMAEDAAAAQALKPASQIYRERMYQGVTEGVRAGKSFSTTPEYAAFEKKLKDQVALGNVPPAEAEKLLRTLRVDRTKGNSALRDRYAETVDDRIRQWGKPAEGAPASGAAAVSSKVAKDVRAALQESYNGYATRLGLGKVEQQYRSAYSQEMIAEAKDKLPHFLYGFGKPEEFAKMARNLGRDPEGKPFLQAVMAKHLSNAEPKAVVAEFERLQKAMVNSELLAPKDLTALREGAAAVKRTADAGLKLRAAEQLKQMMLLALARKGGVAAGGSAAGGQEEE